MNTANKEALRAWLFQLLARVELADDLRAEQTEQHCRAHNHILSLKGYMQCLLSTNWNSL